MKQRNLIILGVLGSIAAVYYLLQFSSGPASPLSLANSALSAKSQDERVKAAVELSVQKGPDVGQQLKRLATESQDVDVVNAALSALATQQRTMEYVPVFFAAMDHDNKSVRQTAFGGARAVHHGSLPDNVQYSADDPPEQRKKIITLLLESHNNRMKPADSKDLDKKFAAAALPDSATKDGKKEATPSAASTETPSASPSGFSPYPPGPPLPPYVPLEYPVVSLLVWMCRILAVLVLFAEVAGMFGLILGERSAAARLAHDKKMQSHSKYGKPDGKSPSVAEEMERVLAKNHSAGLWSKMAILVAGAALVIALLGAAEMFQLAAHVDQNVNFMSSRVR